ncbi:MAG: DUF6572 domain-containing protein [bacterium]|nr:DUF6572 domain-containing protein [bacterium]
MMSDATTIDYVARDDASGKLVLIIKEDRPWDDIRTMHRQLKSKIDTYYQYIMDPDFGREYSGTTPRDVVITLLCLCAPGPQSIQFFQYVRAVLAEDEIGFNYLEKPGTAPDGGAAPRPS